MRRKRSLSIILFFLFFSMISRSQTTATIDSLENESQACLDKGEFMLGCSIHFYNQMDSMLNIVYNKLRSGLDSSQKELLKKEQKEWLKKRDKYFRQTEDKLKKAIKENGGIAAQDDEMFRYEDNARFVKERILELINKLKN